MHTRMPAARFVIALGVAALVIGCAVGRADRPSFSASSVLGADTLPARSGPAVPTRKTASELLVDGYVPIGVVSVTAERETGEPSASAPELMATLLREAGARGGDAVVVTKDAFTSNVTRDRKGACVQMETHIVYVDAYETVCDLNNCTSVKAASKPVSRSSCVKWQLIPYNVTVTSSVGQVFRKDSEMSGRMNGRVLIAAIVSGQPQTALTLLSAGAPAEDRGAAGETALSEAAGRGYDDVVDALLKKGAKVDAPGVGDATPLSRAAAGGHMSTVERLVRRGATTTGELGSSALNAAMSAGHAAVVARLRERGARLDGAQLAGSLIEAAREGNVAALRVLLDNGVSADAKTSASGFTALMAAADGGRVETAKLLLVNGANANAKNTNNGFTPLIYAVRNGNLNLVRLLVAHGADVKYHIGAYGATVLQNAGDNPDIVRILREHGATR